MSLPQIGLSHIESIPEDTFVDFLRLVAPAGLSIKVESREDDAVYASLEWLIPTAVIIFIGKSYFESFFSEMGKDHYSMLKKGLNSLRAKFFGLNVPKINVISTQGKLSAKQRYSLIFSIIAEAETGLYFKLLFQNEVSEDEYEEIVNAFFIFLAEYHSEKLADSNIDMLQKGRVVGNTILISYNLNSKVIEVVDPIPVENLTQ